MPKLETLFRNGREFGLAAGMILILIVLFSPIPPPALDLAIIVNFGLSLTILLLTFYVAKPVEFSTFPSLLLISTLLRLSLNVAATRLILTSAGAGEVINSVGAFAVGGNFVVGLVVFFILVVVQYVVVTSGAQRVSEVAARFTLDSMPGQQMSIDADLNMGLIDQQEAIRRRAGLEKEGAFYGAMDGASKFVKGDAIAGVIILLIDIIAGWIIGVAQMGMSWSDALQRFTLLTIGDGIVTQLPALIISIATGIIVTRSSADRELSVEVFRQLLSAPPVILIVAGVLSLLMLLPGMPKWPILLLAALGYVGWRQMRRLAATKVAPTPENIATSDNSTLASGIAIALGMTLGAAWRPKEALILERIGALRDTQERALGLALPAIKFVDGPQLDPKAYEIRLFGVRYASGEIEPDKVLAIRGENVRQRLDGVDAIDPAFGLPATWIDEHATPLAREAGYTTVDPITVFLTHLGELMRTEASALLNRSAIVKLLDEVRARQPGLVEELVPTLMTVSDVQKVLQALLAEHVSIAAIDPIVEALVDLSRTEKDTTGLAELVRQRMSYAICNNLRGRNRDLAVMSLDPRLENQIQTNVVGASKRDAFALEPRLAEQVLRKIGSMAGEMMRDGREPVLLCGGDIRPQMRTLTRRSVPRLAVLSVSEIPMNIELRSHGVIKLDQPPPQRLATSAHANRDQLLGSPDVQLQ
ncbi:MAG: flagellar biosynthesis protein FlhA [Vitreimonas sp.]